MERARFRRQLCQEGGLRDARKYVIQAGTLGGEPGKATFSITAPPKPKVTATPTKPTKTPPARRRQALSDGQT